MTTIDPDGLIDLDSDYGKTLGFTSDRFDGYLWRADGAIIISAITSKAKGNFRCLVETILGAGLAVRIPTPLAEMRRIVEKEGYRQEWVTDDVFGPVEIWVLEPPQGAV